MDFGHKFRIIHNSIDKCFSRNWENEKIEMTRVQCATLHYLSDHREEPVFQKDIESAFSISGATATNILKGMEKNGLIRRVQMPEDGRLKRILLTEKGVSTEDKGRRNMEKMERCITKGMTEEEISVYRRLLERTIQNIEEFKDREFEEL